MNRKWSLALASLAILLMARQVHSAELRLADAAEKADVAAIRALVGRGVDVNGPQADGMTALHWAAHYDQLEAVKVLISAGANANVANRYGVGPLWLACVNGSGAVVDALIAAGADVNATLAGGETPLMTAARTGQLAPVKALLAHGADANAKERKGQTALMWAAADGHIAVVDALLESGADFATPLPSGFTPLFFAVREGRTAVVLRLLKAGADINQVMRPERRGSGRVRATTPLILAVENGHFELALELLKAGADPNSRPSGVTALHVITNVRRPIRGDGDPPPYGSGNMSSLEFVRQLKAYGAELNPRLERGESAGGRFTTTGSTPFLQAARTNDLPLMRLLLELGADPTIPNADNCTPLLAATGVGALGDGDEAAGSDEESIAAVKLLLELGADINAVDNNGETAIHGAVYQNRFKLVDYLVEHGADIKIWNRRNKSGWTPFWIAIGHRPGNFRPEPETLVVLERVMRQHGVEPSMTKDVPEKKVRTY